MFRLLISLLPKCWIGVALLFSSIAMGQAGDETAPKAGSQGKPQQDPATQDPGKAGKTQPADGQGAGIKLQSIPRKETDSVKAVPRKLQLKRRRLEVSPTFSLSLNDAYYQHMAVGGQMLFYPHDALAFGIGGDWFLGGSNQESTGHFPLPARNDVRQTLIATPVILKFPIGFAHVDVMWVPIYGKISLLQHFILPFDLYTVGGLGIAVTDLNSQSILPAVHVGVGQRYALGSFAALRFELRETLYVDTQRAGNRDQSTVQSYLMLHAGLSFFLPPTFEYTHQ